MRPLILLFTLTCLLTTPPLGASTNSQIDEKVDELLGPLLREDLISGSILIAREGEVLLASGYGPANREYGLPNSPETKFRIGSMTKQFTAMAIFILQEDGLLTIDDTLADYLPDYPNADRITLHQLMTHTSGVPSYNSKGDYHERFLLPWSVNEVIDWFQDDSLLFEPGSDYRYSNSGYVLLAAVIEMVAETPYEEFLRDRIFVPLGMSGSGQDRHTGVLTDRATGHGNDGEIYQAPYRDLPFTSGAGSLYSTVLDLFAWDRALTTDQLIPAAAREQMFTPIMHDYACGWFVDEMFGRKRISHGGAINGFLAEIQRFVDDDVLVITLFNYETTFWRSVNRALAAIALGEDHEPVLITEGVHLEPGRLADIAGPYEIAPDYVLTFLVHDGRLFVTGPEEPRCEGVPQSGNRFFFEGMNAMIEFRSDEGGVIEGFLGLQGAHRFRGKRID